MMNWKRGLWRLWVVSTGLWWIAVAALVRDRWANSEDMLETVFATALAAFAPPFVVLIIGLVGIVAVRWVMLGFEPKKRRPPIGQ